MTEYYNIYNAVFDKAVKSSLIFPVLKVELLDYYENAYEEITQDLSAGSMGSININYQQGVRRTCDITLVNNFKKYNPYPTGRVWFNTKFKVYTGFKIFKTTEKINLISSSKESETIINYSTNENNHIRTNAQTSYIDYDIYWFSQGVFVLTNPDVLKERSNKTVTLNGVDKFGLLGGETNFHSLEGTYQIPMGTKVKDCIIDTLKMPIGDSGYTANLPIDPVTPYIDSRAIDWSYGFIATGESGLNGDKFIIDSCPLIYSGSLEIRVNDTVLEKSKYIYNYATGVVKFQNYLPAEDSEVVMTLDLPVGELTLPYDLEKSPDEYYADIFTELGNIFSCDVFYDKDGVFNFVRSDSKKDFDDMTTIWDFYAEDSNFINPSLSVDFTSMFNVVKVVGTNDAALEPCEATIENRDISSPTCIQNVGKKIKYVESSFCYNQARAKDFAQYLMKKYSMLEEMLNFSTYMLPQLDVNKIISITDDYFNWFGERFIIQSLTIPLTTSGTMEIEATNVLNVPYYEY